MHTYRSAKDEMLLERFRFARAFVDGSIGYFERAGISGAAGVSSRTFARDVQRARQCLTFEDWRPKKRGPPAGRRRSGKVVKDVLEGLTYGRANEKLNVSALVRSARNDLLNMGLQEADIPSDRTMARFIEDIIRADQAHFARARYGRRGRFEHALQLGSLEAELPLQVVCIDHTPLDARVFDLEGFKVIRPHITAAIDVATGACLAAFLSPHAPNGYTVAICLALISADKTPILRSYGIPGDWEAGGIPQTLSVDRGAELGSDAVQSGCERYGISLIVGLPGVPERRGAMERLWRTLNSEIHTWPGTTLSNTEELDRHGGQADAVWTFEQAQYRLLIAAMEYNNETYGQPNLTPFAEWRRLQAGRKLRVTARDPGDVFVDFLPGVERQLTFSGISFERCAYRSGDIASLRYRGVSKVILKYDPRDLREIWVDTPDGQRIKVPRVYPKAAPHTRYALRLWKREKARQARASRDSHLLAQLHAAKQATRGDHWPALLARMGAVDPGEERSALPDSQQMLEAEPVDTPGSESPRAIPHYAVRVL